MSKVYLIISVLAVLYSFENIYCKKSCKIKDDCIVIASCPEAARLTKYRKTNSTINIKIRSALCDSVLVNGKRVLKVCCSEFEVEEIKSQQTINTKTIDGINSSPMSDDNDFTKHNNIGLLPEKCGKYLVDRIVGGEFAHIYEFPWMALISYKTKIVFFGCGGTIISSKYILTAGHCVYNKNINGVRVGEYDIRQEYDCEGEAGNLICEGHLQDLAVEKSIIHENFQLTPAVVNDIALLRVAGEINFMFLNVATICLPIFKEHQNLKFTGKIVDVAGWGITETGYSSVILKKVTVRVRSEVTSENNQQIILAGNAGRDSCEGDSGGPLMHLDQYNKTQCMVQYGIVSYGPKSCASSSPAAYTDVRKYMHWILDNIEK